MLTLKSTDSKQVLETSHEREMLVCSVLTVLTVGTSGCSVISEHRKTNKYNKPAATMYVLCKCMLLTKGVKGVVFATNLYATCQIHTALEQSFSPSISTLTDIHESERSITMVNGKLSSIMFHWHPIHAPHMGDSGLVLVVTGELEVSVKALVGSTGTCSRITCSVRHFTLYIYLQQKFTVVGFAFIYICHTNYAHTLMHINVHKWTQCN